MKCVNNEDLIYKKEVKSYVRRSRMTERQRQGLDQGWSSFGLAANGQPLDFKAIFNREAPTILEIGFGMGVSLLELANNNPNLNFIGIEVHRPGIGALLSAVHEAQLTNVRVLNGDALELIPKLIKDASLFGVLLFFPDPWPKSRHHKRRIVQQPLVSMVYNKLSKNGYFHLATDVSHYANQMREVIIQHPGLTIIDEPSSLPGSLARPATKFELRGKRLGHEISDIVCIKDS